ncbi:MAG: M1 family metallopeptidase [Candidatus Aminicenantes bacterium]
MKKTRIFWPFLLVFLFHSAFAQDIPHHKRGLKYDIRLLAAQAPAHHFDVLHYGFDWKINFESRHLQGKALIRARSLINDLNQISLHLDDSMVVTSIHQNQIPLNYVHQNDLLDIFLAQNSNLGEEFELEIFYQGYPQAGLNFSFHQQQPIIWSLDEPMLARQWFPCYDLPSDKVTAEMRISVPATMIAASNGSLADIISNLDGTVTYVWREKYPMATYLISVAATNYKIFSDIYSSGSQDMEVFFFAYPEHLSAAREDFSVTVSMIEFFSLVFGEYPFIEEKYAMAEIPGDVSMEHQTCTSYSSGLVTGTHRYDWIVAHELAHQWWGDLVTLADWADIWLNEGFATYSDALWHQHIHGHEGIKERMENFKNIYFTRHQGEEHPIYDPPSGHLFCTIEYEKAAWVLHMLRFVVGEDNFWKILKKYARDYAYSTAATGDFRKVCEQVYGGDLGWFFDQWIYKSGYPSYQVGWGSLSQNQVRIIVKQVQEEFPLFQMPVELKFIFPSGSEKRIIWADKKTNIFDFFFPHRPLQVLFDPDHWILCTVEDFQKRGKSKR